MKCISCGAKTVTDTTTDVTDINNCLVIIRNVPCHKCIECDEIIYTGEVMRILDEITTNANTSMNEISVVNYENKVA